MEIEWFRDNEGRDWQFDRAGRIATMSDPFGSYVVAVEFGALGNHVMIKRAPDWEWVSRRVGFGGESLECIDGVVAHWNNG